MEHGRFRPGDRVRHCGTKQYATVVRVHPRHYGVELEVSTDPNSEMTRWWEGRRVDRHYRDGMLL